MGYAELVADLPDAFRGRFKLHGRGSGDHPEALRAQASDLGDHLLCQPVAEVVVLVARGEVLDRQDHQHDPTNDAFRRLTFSQSYVCHEAVTALRQGLYELSPVRIPSQG